MRTIIHTILFVMALAMPAMSFAQATNVCAGYNESPCDPGCDNECSYRTCTVGTMSMPMPDMRNLPLHIHVPPNCRDPGGANIRIEWIPFDLGPTGYNWQTSRVPHPSATLQYPICSTSTVTGPACTTTTTGTTAPGACAVGTEITTGPNAGKCSGECSSGNIPLYLMDGTPAGSIIGACSDVECNPPGGPACANYVNCYKKNLCTGALVGGGCSLGPSRALACGAVVSTAVCNKTIVGGEVTVDCMMVPISEPAPGAGDPGWGPTPSPAACGAPTTTTTTLPPNCTDATCTSCLRGFDPASPSCSACPAGQGVGTGGNCETTSNCVGGFNACSAPCSASAPAGGTRVFVITTQASGGGAACAYAAGATNGVACNIHPACASAGGGGGCFVGGTQISMADGSTKPIELVKVGDLVITMDEETGDNIVSPVVKTHHHTPKMEKIYEFKMANGAVLISNNIHPIFVWEKQAYYKAEQIMAMYIIGERLSFVDASGKAIEINTIEHYEKNTAVYNFEVAGMNKNSMKLGAYGQGHNYFAEGFLVHNALYSIIKSIYFNWLGEMSQAVMDYNIK